MNRTDVEKAVATCDLVERCYYFDTLSSTQDRAKELVEQAGPDGDVHGTLVVARDQTAGRGRFGRRWHSVPGKSLLMSLLLRKNRIGFLDDGGDASMIPLLAAVAVYKSVMYRFGETPWVKFPNDVMCANGKLAGVLVETVRATSSHLVIGIGINVNQTREELRALDVPATSLAIESGSEWCMENLLRDVLQNLHTILRTSVPAEPVLAQHGPFHPHKVHVRTALGEVVEGVPSRITGTGGLVVRGDEGELVVPCQNISELTLVR